MPNTREKLIELCEDVILSCKSSLCADCEHNEIDYPNCMGVHFADHLIANGVTVGKPLAEYLHPIDNYVGLKGKYLVFKADTGEQVVNCFVLRPDKDTAAVEALRAYARATGNKTLSDDIYSWVGDGATVNGWIPVTERLPDAGIEVLAMLQVDKFDGHSAHNVTTAVMMPSGGWLVADYQEGIEAETVETDCEDCVYWITHWMPLPEPPKEGE